MKTLFTTFITVILLFLVGYQLYSNKQLVEARVYHYNPDFPVLVDVATVSTVSEAQKETFRGQFEAGKESKLSIDIQGKVTEVYVEIGESVKKGQVLLQLDKTLLNLQLEAARVQHQSVSADLERTKVLAAQQAVQQVQLEKLTHAVAAAEIQVKTIQEQLQKTTLKAPFEGIITQKFTEIGSFAAPGMPLFQLSEVNHMRFTVQVSEQELGLLNDSTKYQIVADAFPKESFSAKPLYVNAKAGMSNQYSVQLEVSNSNDLKLKSGMFGRVELQLPSSEQLLKIPARALVGSVEQPVVYSITDGKAYKTPVQFVEHNGKEVIISGGLSAGDQVVIGGIVQLYHGAPVQLNTSEQE